MRIAEGGAMFTVRFENDSATFRAAAKSFEIACR
jgi:hypothetical protein